MKKKNLKKISLIGFLASLVLWIALSYFLRNVSLFGFYIGEMLFIVLSGLPFAFLQLRLCLTDKEKWVRWVPLAVDIATYILSVILYLTGGFEAELMALILVVWGIAPSAGICLGWLAHGKKIALLPLNIMLIIYLALENIPIIARPIELTDIAAALYVLLGVYLFIRPIERGGENEPKN